MKKKRQTLTLIEMMLVILLIGVVGGALAFNLKGAVYRGKRFKTELMEKKIESILNLALLEGYSPQEVQENWVTLVKNSPLIQLKGDPKEIYDAWGKPFQVTLGKDHKTLSVTSNALSQDNEAFLF